MLRCGRGATAPAEPPRAAAVDTATAATGGRLDKVLSHQFLSRDTTRVTDDEEVLNQYWLSFNPYDFGCRHSVVD